MTTTDLIIIGAGPGGYETAIAAAREGMKVVLVEAEALGGTCLNEGCIPTKCLCRSAEVADLMKEAATFGVVAESGGINLVEVMKRKNEVVAQLAAGVASLLKSPGITLVQGKATFAGPHEVIVGEEHFSAPHIMVATGSSAKNLPISGADLPGVVTSREMLQLEQIPKRLCVIGGGVVGMEFASVFRSFGSEVSVVEYAKEILPSFDRDIAKRLRTALKRKGISFNVGAAVTEISKVDGGYKVAFVSGNKEGQVEADLVLMAVGRGPRLQHLGLDEIGMQYTSRGIVVDENMQTNIEGVYAIGDVNGICPLAHAATAQGRCALYHILGKDGAPDLQLVPAAVFTVPEVAMVGHTEETASAAGLEYSIRKAFYRANGKSLSMGESEGIVKILVGPDGLLLGAHVLGAHAADLIHELALAMHAKMGVERIQSLIHAHPSLSEILHDAVMNA
jgi:dihydrolipoamide dehydrogenase